VDLGCIVLLSNLCDSTALTPSAAAKISKLTHGGEPRSRANLMERPNEGSCHPSDTGKIGVLRGPLLRAGWENHFGRPRHGLPHPPWWWSPNCPRWDRRPRCTGPNAAFRVGYRRHRRPGNTSITWSNDASNRSFLHIGSQCRIAWLGRRAACFACHCPECRAILGVAAPGASIALNFPAILEVPRESRRSLTHDVVPMRPLPRTVVVHRVLKSAADPVGLRTLAPNNRFSDGHRNLLPAGVATTT
jgi:hypothetical protein